MQELVKIWHDDDDYWDDNDDLAEWFNDYKQHKAWKAQIKEEFIPIDRHLTRMQELKELRLKIKD